MTDMGWMDGFRILGGRLILKHFEATHSLGQWCFSKSKVTGTKSII